jgi:hypothetical protein
MSLGLIILMSCVGVCLFKANGTEVKNKKFEDYFQSLETLVVTIIEVAYIRQIRYVYYCY